MIAQAKIISLALARAHTRTHPSLCFWLFRSILVFFLLLVVAELRVLSLVKRTSQFSIVCLFVFVCVLGCATVSSSPSLSPSGSSASFENRKKYIIISFTKILSTTYYHRNIFACVRVRVMNTPCRIFRFGVCTILSSYDMFHLILPLQSTSQLNETNKKRFGEEEKK